MAKVFHSQPETDWTGAGSRLITLAWLQLVCEPLSLSISLAGSPGFDPVWLLQTQSWKNSCHEIYMWFLVVLRRNTVSCAGPPFPIQPSEQHCFSYWGFLWNTIFLHFHTAEKYDMTNLPMPNQDYGGIQTCYHNVICIIHPYIWIRSGKILLCYTNFSTNLLICGHLHILSEFCF